MAYRCSHCGAQAPTGAKICFMCGGQVADDGGRSGSFARTEIGTPLFVGGGPPGGASPPMAAPTPAGPPGGWGPPPGAAAVGPYAGPPHAAPPAGMAAGYPVRAGQPPAAPVGMMAPPGPPGYGPAAVGGAPYAPGYGQAPRKDDSALKLGCGVAGCVGVLLVLLVVGGVLYFMLQSDRPVASSSPSREPSSAQGPSSDGPSSDGPSTGPTAAPSSGSLRSLVQEQVGEYRLVASSPNVADGPFRAGAVDSLGLRYQNVAGVEVKHFLIVYGTEAEAASKPQAMIELIRSKIPVGQTFNVNSQPYRNREGEVIGKVYHVELDPEVVMWNNGKLFAVANAPSGHAVKFFKAVPY